jgi:hypothetical protein
MDSTSVPQEQSNSTLTILDSSNPTRYYQEHHHYQHCSVQIPALLKLPTRKMEEWDKPFITMQHQTQTAQFKH